VATSRCKERSFERSFAHGARKRVSDASGARCAQEPFQAVKLAQRIACIKRMFSFFDEDQSGEIDIDEFDQLLRMVGKAKSRAQVETMFKKMDADSSGLVSEDEFIQAVLEMEEEAKD